MENNRSSFNADSFETIKSTEISQATHVRSFISGVFSWMFLALILSAVTAWLFANNEALLSLLLNNETGRLKLTILGWVVMLAPIGLVMVMSFALEKLSVPVLIGLFVLYSTLLGASLSFIFLAYLGGTIVKAFLVTSGVFAIMAVLGYTTKTDLSKMGSILMIGVVGIVIAMVVNIFLKSEMMSIIIDCVCVIVFTGLIAYKMQAIKTTAISTEGSQPALVRKYQIISALSLYITFINLFLTLLRIFGRRN
jgi:uncharacterized protein